MSSNWGDERQLCGEKKKKAIWAKIWEIGRILIGKDSRNGLLLARSKGTKSDTYWIIWGQPGVCFEYIGGDMCREVWELQLSREVMTRQWKESAGRRVGIENKEWKVFEVMSDRSGFLKFTIICLGKLNKKYYNCFVDSHYFSKI